jgi:hypothetical protein
MIDSLAETFRMTFGDFRGYVINIRGPLFENPFSSEMGDATEKLQLRLLEQIEGARFDVPPAVKIQVKAFWFVTSCGVAVGYQRVRGPCCLRLHPRGGGSMD